MVCPRPLPAQNHHAIRLDGLTLRPSPSGEGPFNKEVYMEDIAYGHMVGLLIFGGMVWMFGIYPLIYRIIHKEWPAEK